MPAKSWIRLIGLFCFTVLLFSCSSTNPTVETNPTEPVSDSLSAKATEILFATTPTPNPSATFTTVPTQTSTPAPTMASPTATLGEINYDGVLTGTTSSGKKISFKVEKNQIIFLDFSYTIQSGGTIFTVSAMDLQKIPMNAADKSFSLKIDDGQFLIEMGDLAGSWMMQFSGTFQDQNTAIGTYKRSYRDAFNVDLTWEASRDITAATPLTP